VRAARQDCGKFKRWWGKYAGSLAFVLLIALGVVGFFRIEAVATDAEQAATDAEQAASGAQKTVKRQDREQKARRDQACVLFERTYREGRRSYRRDRQDFRVTRRYVERVPPAERDTQLNVAIRAGLKRQRDELRRTKREVRAQRPPKYCARPGVGLDRATPKLPPLPRPMETGGIPTAWVIVPVPAR
jgi:hypothetical protein